MFLSRFCDSIERSNTITAPKTKRANTHTAEFESDPHSSDLLASPSTSALRRRSSSVSSIGDFPEDEDNLAKSLGSLRNGDIDHLIGRLPSALVHNNNNSHSSSGSLSAKNKQRGSADLEELETKGSDSPAEASLDRSKLSSATTARQQETTTSESQNKRPEGSATRADTPKAPIQFVRKHRGSLPPSAQTPVRTQTADPPSSRASTAKVDLPVKQQSASDLDPTTTLSAPSLEPLSLKTPPPPAKSSVTVATSESKIPKPMAPNQKQTEKMQNQKETKTMPTMTTNNSTAATQMFDLASRSDRPAPQMPSASDNIEYPRAASWSSSTVAEILRDPLGKQVFRCFLYESLAEENLLFVEELDKLKKEKDPAKVRDGINELLERYGNYINLSSVAMAKLKEASKCDNPDGKCLDLAHKEISKLLENDQFPRFRRSTIYLGFLEKLLPRSYAEKWTTSFDALLGNQVGRHHFRQFLFNVHAEENLRFWESVVEFRGLKNKSPAMLNMGKQIQLQFLKEGAPNEVFLPFGLRQKVDKRIKEKDVDETLFDDAVKHVEQILKNDPYVRFLQSKEYNQLLAKLH
ncbi:regulator of G protein signaling domain-containing protein [Ditylenchus destructor]|nr:regulator of G protein signaling domain-containing protein [Ditylenchus destructor]